MNKILLNILIFVGFQQFILGAEVNKKIEPKLGVCLYCYTFLACDHPIYDTYEEGKNNCENCVKEVYSVCPEGHTMCAECILEHVNNGVKDNRGVIKCIFFNQKEPIYEKEFNPCLAQIDKKVVIQILKKSKIDKKKLLELKINKKKLLEKYIEMQKEIIFLEPQNKRCKYKKCTGFFDVTKGFICKKNNNHKHCGNCFNKIHEGKCKDPLEEYKDYIQQNEEIHKKIQNGELKARDTEGFKPCPNCHRIIVKCGGCNHITCGKDYNSGDWVGKGCGYQWCWRCGKACFCDDKGAPGYSHYNYNYNNDNKNNSCEYKHCVNTDAGNQNYFDDGDYFGIKNGKFKEQFEKLAKDMSIDVKVKTPTKYPKIKKIKWDRIIKARKKYQKEQQKKQQAVDDSTNRCTECCCEEC